MLATKNWYEIEMNFRTGYRTTSAENFYTAFFVPAVHSLGAPNYGKAMQEGMHRVLSRRGIPHSFTGHYSMSGLFFSAQAPTNHGNLS